MEELTKEQEQVAQSFMEKAEESEIGNRMVEATARLVVKLDEVDEKVAMEILDIVADVTAMAIAYGEERVEEEVVKSYFRELLDNGGVPAETILNGMD